jgi:cytochrome P450
MVDPKEHGPRRKLLSGSFSKSYLMKHWEGVVRDKAMLCVEKIKGDAVREEADVFNWWMLLASDVTGHLSFGEPFGMLQAGKVRTF